MNKTGIGYAFTESVEKIKPTAAKTEETCESLPPVFSESAPKFTLDTVYLLLMGDSMYKKAWFLQSVGYIEKLPPLSLEPGSADTVAEDAFYSWILPESIWARILCTYPEESDRRALYGGEGTSELLLDLKQDFQNDSGWRGRELTSFTTCGNGAARKTTFIAASHSSSSAPCSASGISKCLRKPAMSLNC